MTFFRKVANSDIFADIIEIPKDLRNKKVEILIFPYENLDDEEITIQRNKNVRGILAKYKNEELQSLEDDAWAKAVEDKYENSWCKRSS